jgi:hypothetical protein
VAKACPDSPWDPGCEPGVLGRRCISSGRTSQTRVRSEAGTLLFSFSFTQIKASFNSDGTDLLLFRTFTARLCIFDFDQAGERPKWEGVVSKPFRLPALLSA